MVKFILLIFLLLCLNPKSKACSCHGKSTLKEEINNSKIVVLGEVLSIERVYIKFKVFDGLEEIDSIFAGMFLNKISFQVTSIFKGKPKMKNITIYTGVGGGDCGVRFKIKGKYIVFASNPNLSYANNFNSENFKKSLWTDICTSTEESNSEQIQKIEKIKKIKR